MWLEVVLICKYTNWKIRIGWIMDTYFVFMLRCIVLHQRLHKRDSGKLHNNVLRVYRIGTVNSDPNPSFYSAYYLIFSA